MKTFIERIEEKRNTCVTIDDWKAAFEWLIQEACNLNDDSLRMQNAIIEKYGEHALDELIEMAMSDDFENDFTPAMREMINYGYENMDIIPLQKEMAMNFFEKECKVYLLYPNNSEKEVSSKEELEAFDGMFGVSIHEISNKMAEKSGFSLSSDLEK